MQKNNKTKGYPDQQDSPQKKNSKARIKATDKYNKANYKNLSIRVKPDQAEKIRETAQRHHLSLAQLIITAVDYFDTNHSDTITTENRTDTADTVTASDTEENTTSTTTEDTAERIPEYIKNMIDRSKAYDKDFSEKQRAKRKVERERAKAEYNLID